jgi:tetratricopeptide (TPR) repeat protein
MKYQVKFLLILMLLLGFATAVGAEEKSAESYFKQGAKHLKKGQFDQAIADSTKALEINPRYAKAYLNRGAAYVGKGQHDRVIADCNKALEINPRLAEAYNNRAVAYYSKKDYDKAWKDVRKAQSLGYKVHPGFLEALSKASGREK